MVLTILLIRPFLQCFIRCGLRSLLPICAQKYLASFLSWHYPREYHRLHSHRASTNDMHARESDNSTIPRASMPLVWIAKTHEQPHELVHPTVISQTRCKLPPHAAQEDFLPPMSWLPIPEQGPLQLSYFRTTLPAVENPYQGSLYPTLIVSISTAADVAISLCLQTAVGSQPL